MYDSLRMRILCHKFMQADEEVAAEGKKREGGKDSQRTEDVLCRMYFMTNFKLRSTWFVGIWTLISRDYIASMHFLDKDEIYGISKSLRPILQSPAILKSLNLRSILRAIVYTVRWRFEKVDAVSQQLGREHPKKLLLFIYGIMTALHTTFDFLTKMFTIPPLQSLSPMTSLLGFVVKELPEMKPIWSFFGPLATSPSIIIYTSPQIIIPNCRALLPLVVFVALRP
jgi:hypothetical protein